MGTRPQRTRCERAVERHGNSDGLDREGPAPRKDRAFVFALINNSQTEEVA